MKIDELTAQNLALEARVRALEEALRFCASDESDRLYFTVLSTPPKTRGQMKALQVLNHKPTPDPSPLTAVVDAAVEWDNAKRSQSNSGVARAGIKLHNVVQALPDYMRRKEGTQ